MVVGEIGWSQTPSELLTSILERLPTADRARFRSVCSAWKNAPPPFHTLPEPPWLMFCLPPQVDLESSCGGEKQEGSKDQGNQKPRRLQKLVRFYSILDNRVYNLNGGGELTDFMEECRAIVCYCPGGWLMYMDRVCELQCIHLSTGRRIHPPSITTLRDVKGVKTNSQGRITGYYINSIADDHFLSHGMYRYYHRGIILFDNDLRTALCSSTNTGTAPEYFIAVAHHFDSQVSATVQGGTSWTSLPKSHGADHVRNFTLHKGSIYGVEEVGQCVFRLEPNYDLSLLKVSHLPSKFMSLPVTLTNIVCAVTAYLADINGHLWLIRRLIDYESPEPYPQADAAELEEYDVDSTEVRRTTKTFRFKVFRFYESVSTWVEMDTIGDYAIFVGNNYSIVLSTDDFPQLTKDCIYFTDDEFDHYIRLTWWDLGVFNLRDHTVRKYYDGRISMGFPQPTWVLPFSFYE